MNSRSSTSKWPSSVLTELDHGDLPDVLTIFFSGTDLYAHVADEGPDEARRSYLKEIVDPALAKLLGRACATVTPSTIATSS